MDTTRWPRVVSFFGGYCARRNTAVTSRRLIWLVSFERGAHVADIVANGSGRTCLCAQPCITWFVTTGEGAPAAKGMHGGNGTMTSLPIVNADLPEIADVLVGGAGQSGA